MNLFIFTTSPYDETGGRWGLFRWNHDYFVFTRRLSPDVSPKLPQILKTLQKDQTMEM